MSLKHQNSGKWAKSKAIMAKYDLEVRPGQEVMELEGKGQVVLKDGSKGRVGKDIRMNGKQGI